jgi:hypothetical protein
MQAMLLVPPNAPAHFQWAIITAAAPRSGDATRPSSFNTVSRSRFSPSQFTGFAFHYLNRSIFLTLRKELAQCEKIDQLR